MGAGRGRITPGIMILGTESRCVEGRRVCWDVDGSFATGTRGIAGGPRPDCARNDKAVSQR